MPSAATQQPSCGNPTSPTSPMDHGRNVIVIYFDNEHDDRHQVPPPSGIADRGARPGSAILRAPHSPASCAICAIGGDRKATNAAANDLCLREHITCMCWKQAACSCRYQPRLGRRGHRGAAHRPSAVGTHCDGRGAGPGWRCHCSVSTVGSAASVVPSRGLG